MIEAICQAGVRAACEGLFPRNDLGVPDFESTEMVPRMHGYFAALPATQRRLLRSLFVVVELGSLLLCASRFSKLSPERRAAAVRRWRTSRWLPIKLLGDALKATTTLIYMSHPSAMRYLGAYKTCSREADRMGLPVRPGALLRLPSKGPGPREAPPPSDAPTPPRAPPPLEAPPAACPAEALAREAAPDSEPGAPATGPLAPVRPA